MADYDLLVLGGGPAGYVGAIRAAQLGKKVACIERDRAGGTCLNWGCIPTKALLKNAQLYTQLTKGTEAYGVTIEGEIKVDWSKVIGRSRSVSDRLAGGIEHLFKKNKIDYLRGEAKLGDNGRVEYTTAEGETKTVTADKILLATGAASRSIPGLEFNGKTVLNARQAMVIDHQPKSIAIIGAGAIGVEFAHFFRAYGTEVTIVEMLDNLLPVEDTEVSQTLERAFKKNGVQLKLGHKTVGSEVREDGVTLTLEPAKGGEQIQVHAECVLVAVGVVPVLPEGAEKLAKTERGWIQVGDNYDTSIPNIYAAGDLTGPPWLAHTASFEAIQCIEGLYIPGHQPKKVTIFPGCTYCHPEVASVGKTERALKEAGVKYKVGKFPFLASGRALAAGDAEGFVKLLYGEENGELLGAHIIGPEATELIAEMGLAITMEATYEDLETTIHAHPTLSEAIHEATGVALGHPIHI